MDRPVPPGRLGNADRAALAGMWRPTRGGRGWAPVAEALLRHRAGGVPMEVLAEAVGVGRERVGMICRTHGPDPATVGDLLTEAGWIPPAAAAELLGVSPAQLETHTAAAEQAGISVTLARNRHWHASSLTNWWADTTSRTPTATARAARRARAARVRAAVTAGTTWQQAAHDEDVNMHTVWRDLRGVRR